MKKKIIVFMAAVSLLALTACSESSDPASTPDTTSAETSAVTEAESNPVGDYVKSIYDKYGWKEGMTEDEFTNANDILTYTMNTSLSFITENGSTKYLDSSETVDFFGEQAKISAMFIDGELFNIDFKIDFEKSDIIDPAKQFYNKISFEYLDILGNPTSSDDFLEELDTGNGNTLRWRDNEGRISLYYFETTGIIYSGSVTVSISLLPY